MSAEIVNHGKLSEKREEYIYFYCNNDKCKCVFKVKDNDKTLKITESKYGFFKNKRKIIYSYICPECNKFVYTYHYPDEYDDI